MLLPMIVRCRLVVDDTAALAHLCCISAAVLTMLSLELTMLSLEVLMHMQRCAYLRASG